MKLQDADVRFFQGVADLLGLERRSGLVGNHDGFVGQADFDFVDARQLSQIDLRDSGTGAARDSGCLHRNLLDLSESWHGGEPRDYRQEQRLLSEFHVLTIPNREYNPGADKHHVQHKAHTEDCFNAPRTQTGSTDLHQPHFIRQCTDRQSKEEWLQPLEPKQTARADQRK